MAVSWEEEEDEEEGGEVTEREAEKQRDQKSNDASKKFLPGKKIVLWSIKTSLARLARPELSLSLCSCQIYYYLTPPGEEKRSRKT